MSINLISFAILFCFLMLPIQSVDANTCTYNGTVEIAETHKITINECWDLSSWPKAKAKQFCQEQAQDETSVKVNFCEGGCKCKIGFTGTCTFKLPSSSESKSLPKEYLANIPPEMRKQVEDNFKKTQAEMASPYGGQSVKLYYYPGKGTSEKIQKDDCKNKNGKYGKI